MKRINIPYNADEGLLRVGGEKGKRVISEAYQVVGLPPLMSYNTDLVFANLKNKAPLKWIVMEVPVAYNIHPAPPEKPGAGTYIPSLLAGEKFYGVTTHYLNEVTDDGSIISVLRFPIPDARTESSLRTLSLQYCLESLEDILLRMKSSDSLTDLSTSCHYMWRGKEITRKKARRLRAKLQ